MPRFTTSPSFISCATRQAIRFFASISFPSAQDQGVDHDARRHHEIGIDLSGLDDLAHLGDHEIGGHGDQRIEIARRAAVHQVALGVGLVGLDDRQIGSLMVPRGDVVCLDLDAPFEENLRRIEESDHARFPVVRGGMDHLKGVLNARQWLSRALRDPKHTLEDQPLQTALYVPETITGMELLDNFRLSDVHMAFVIDEYGEVQGIVTLQDLIEAITGEFQPRDPETSWALQREDGSWLLDGHIPVPELKDRLNLDSVPEEERGRYHTLSGMVMLLTGRLPKVTDTVQWENWKLEVVDMDGKTIDKVLATRLPSPEDSAAEAQEAGG